MCIFWLFFCDFLEDKAIIFSGNSEARRGAKRSIINIGREPHAYIDINESGFEPLNLENKLWKGVVRHCSLRSYLWCEGSLVLEQAHKAFFHSRVCFDICKIKKFKIKKLFVTQACLYVLHYMCMYMSSLCCSQKWKDHFVWSKVRYTLCETLEPAVHK